MQAFSFPTWSIYLDLDPRVHVGTGNDSSMEWAIRIAAGLASRGIEQRGHVILQIGESQWKSDRFDGHSHLMDALALTQGTSCSLGDGLHFIHDSVTPIVITTDIAINRFTQAAPWAYQWIILRASGFETQSDRALTLPLAINPLLCMRSPGQWEVKDD